MAYDAKIREDGILQLSFIGNVEINDLESYESEFLLPHLETLAQNEKLPILFYADKEGRYSVAARKKLNTINDNPRLGRIAVLKGSRVSQVLVTLLLKVSGKDNIKFFDEETAAVPWLLAEQEI